MSVIYTVDTILDQLEKKNVLAVTLFSFFLIFHVLSIIIHVFYPNFAFSKEKELFLTPFWVITLLGQSTTLPRLYI